MNPYDADPSPSTYEEIGAAVFATIFAVAFLGKYAAAVTE